MIALKCKCGKPLQVPESVVGRKGTCPNCKATLRFIAPHGVLGESDFQASLTVVAGPRAVGDAYLLGGKHSVTLGKNPDQDITLPGQRVSRAHAQLIRQSSAWAITDSRSTNGTFVEDRRLSSVHTLKDGEFIRLGDYEFKYSLIDPLPRMTQTSASQPPPLQGSEATDDAFADDDFHADDIFDLASVENAQPAAVIAPPEVQLPPEAQAHPDDGPLCPGCSKHLPYDAKICIDCGINIYTGKALLTTQDANLDAIYSTTEQLVRGISWLIRFGIYPVASEAFGTAKPYTIRALAVVTVLISVWFWLANGDGEYSNLMLWVGEPITSEALEEWYRDEYGVIDEEIQEYLEQDMAEVANMPHMHGYQLITHAFLHADIFHLLGNLLFLLIFGSRVNALLGNLWTAVAYPVLAVGAGMIYMGTSASGWLSPMLGASGAIMGLAGMYIVLMPVHKIHMAFWFRFGFYLNFKIFAVRGFWVVLFYIAFDVLYTWLDVEDGVAHWAHLGGFIVGISLATLLLMTRLINARGSDIFTAMFGKHAWHLIGKPRARS